MAKTPHNKPATLVMTATVQPPSGMPGSVRNDPQLRLREYLEAFRFYLTVDDALVDQIVIMENSDADLSPFARVAAEQGSTKRLQLINTSSEYPASKGKGYGEFRMVDEGLSRLIASGAVQMDTPMWKLTGRLKLLNIAEMLATAPAGYGFYCDLRKVPLIGERLGGNDWMELRVFSFTPAAYDACLRGQYGKSYVLEKAFFTLLTGPEAAGGKARVVPRFRRQPRLAGVSGHSNKSYEGLGYRAKNTLRSVARVLAPRLWL
ncbi:hypothetical protein [Uliginosibacterium sp. H1]|uniref:hypothetical protein n=1 Tax=Uliginosibacterium sp. H1 TaxID=3114757 RepID=UPI002E189D6D|nr:hypothetical protein [Uliginosibacterium sp. H1]